ncbi:DUF552 domain-containing protein [Eggerthellaceae bacterium zg-887]|uniref:cell division protein SepF n=1 Tax=Xiamenia xianingshaonis TaxID=2682776 RepID=UPI00140AF426|nr:cell division protein SepF [Xiamenia xianingshaonis]NHM15491.1 DUF552 domain-containing protein [Xiamenia xianingshaonis]
MDSSRGRRSQGGVFDGLKSRLGFSGSTPPLDDDDEYGGGFAEFEEYGESYQPASDSSASAARDPYVSVTTRPAYARRPGGVSVPNLVSIEDVRARTQLPDSLQRDPLPPRQTTSARSGYRAERTMVETANPAHPSTPNGRAAAASNQERSESINRIIASADAERASGSGAGAASGRGAAYDPYDAYAGRAGGSHIPSRGLKVIKPREYGDVESVARAIKAGDAVVLALSATPDALSKRILDFAFGVASALDASVDCAASKVFVVTRNGALTQAERTTLKNQGVL